MDQIDDSRINEQKKNVFIIENVGIEQIFNCVMISVKGVEVRIENPGIDEYALLRLEAAKPRSIVSFALSL